MAVKNAGIVLVPVADASRALRVYSNVLGMSIRAFEDRGEDPMLLF